MRLRERLGSISEAVESAAASQAGIVERIWSRDHKVWQDDPTEIVDRLGWLDCPAGFPAQLDWMRDVARQAASDGKTRAVVSGMGGSSLFPDVLARTFDPGEEGLTLEVLDSTDPASVQRVAEGGLEDTVFVVASKSGTTIETRSHFDWLWERVSARHRDDAGASFVAITDPGSELAQLARQRSFREVFENPTDIGGRFSALSFFGLVPGALLGVDLDTLLVRAQAGATSASADEGPDNPAFRLGIVMGAAATAGRNKLTLLLPEDLAAFGAWVEQLVAESTGKHGTGILPVVDEPVGEPDVYGSDRLFVAVGDHAGVDALAEAGHPVVELPYIDPFDLGSQVFVWEFATAIAGAVLGVNPFDQPDVAAAKAATSRVLEEGLEHPDTVELSGLLDQVEEGDYVAITAFVDPGSAVVGQLEQVRLALRDRLHVPVTLGIGPRYLHSTGQLHKGGPNTGVVVQVISEDAEDLDIPERPYGFSTLKEAQAEGDLQALIDRGIRAGRVALEELLAATG